MDIIKCDKAPSFTESVFSVVSLFCFTGGMQKVLSAGDDAASTDGNTAFQILWTSIYILAAIFIAVKAHSVKKLFSLNISLLVLVTYVGISFLWSQTVPISLRKEAGIIGPTLFAFYLASRYDQEAILKLCFQAIGIAALGSIVLGILFPEFGIMHRDIEELNGSWCGVFTHKNTLGQIMLGYALINVSLYKIQPKVIYKCGFLLSSVLIILSRSSTSLLLLLLIILLNYSHYFFRLKTSIKAFIFIIAILFFVIVIVISDINELMMHTIGKDLTFTGRDELWKLILPSIYNNLFFGKGYGGFWLGEAGESGKINVLIGPLYDNAHNGYFDICLDLGLVGLFIFLSIYIPFFLKSFKEYIRNDNKTYFFSFSFLLVQCIYNFFESNFMRPNNIFWILFVLIITSNKVKIVKIFPEKINSLDKHVSSFIRREAFLIPITTFLIFTLLL